MLICPTIGDTDPIRCHRPSPDSQFSGNILDEAMRPLSADNIVNAPALTWVPTLKPERRRR